MTQTAVRPDTVARARSGDADAFGSLYADHYPAVRSYLVGRVPTVAIAEDLASETFLRALRGIAECRSDGDRFPGWLIGIARGLADDHHRSPRSRHEWLTDDPVAHDVEGVDALAALDRLEVGELLRSAVLRLPESQRDCLVLRFLHQRSLQETAGLLGVSTGAVKQLQLRGTRNLARLLTLADDD